MSRCHKFFLGLLSVSAVLILVPESNADVRLPSIFSDHMVLQRGMPVPVWGWSEPQELVTVTFDGKSHQAEADNDGKWKVLLDPLKVGDPKSLVVKGTNTIEVKDVLVGEVWICSGQSNMQWPVKYSTDADLELLNATNNQIRLLTVGGGGEQQPRSDFDGAWQLCNSGNASQFSAVGYHFGKRLQAKLGVPIGLIDNAWGGSACEAWIPREKMEGDDMYQALLNRWDTKASEADEDALRAEYAAIYEDWKGRFKAAALESGDPPPECPNPKHPLLGQQRPANLYNARVMPVMPFAIRGVIWYQGEANASRAEQYAEMFPLMISTWREVWKQGDFPFYWVQLADFRNEAKQPGQSDWAELREAQTRSLDRVPNSGQAVIIDLGEGKDIHPKDKRSVADRLSRLALSKEYGFDLAHQSPRLESSKVVDGSIEVTLQHCRSGLTTFDTKVVTGFAIAGADKKWFAAKAEIVGKNRVLVSSEVVPEPSAVRYAWADNPVCNLYNRAGLPVTPFRTDEWPGVTAGKR